MRRAAWLVCTAACTFAHADDATFTVRQLTPETALKAAQAALAKCRADGYQVSVAVVDRAGLTQVLLRDRFAGPHTVEISTNKAWSAVSFRTNTTDIERSSRPGESMSGIRSFSSRTTPEPWRSPDASPATIITRIR